ncbi:protein dead ringer isoform X1 [Tribolium castaneum]|uniref:protein dead ringer isoform X1 n=2 Tax=Tribolium castaneum TaxID=7070 RepID=UPI00046C149E|nr:PREDICTED: protein dead ringer isoform X1 [Tribolium castaneum]|eukprot:XP_008196287.1 PREDICTED: protein dead ringer isoform X1 [Tribolium castaneum]
MEMDPQERESDLGDDSPVSHNDEEISDGDGESGREHDDVDSCDEIRRHGGGILADHGDVLAKLKMQVRDIKVGDDFENATRHLNFPLTNRSLQDNFHLPAPFPFPHPSTPFMTPLLPPPAAPSSGSSHSSEGSASSQHTWSFEEQFKQVRQLYEINDDPKRKEFLDDLFSFMQKRGTPINRLPIMAKSVLDLYELYNLVIARGGLVDVINKKLWQEIIKGLHLPSSITSAAFTLRTQYMKYLYPYECEKRRLSTPAELQAAIDGNRREGRRSSYGQYDSMQRSPNPSQMSPLSLVSQQQQLAARMNSVMSGGMALHNGAHHPSHPQPLGQPLNGGPLPGLAPSEFEARMMEYVKLLNKEIRSSAATPPRQGDVSPPNATSPLNQLELSRITLWNMYNNNQPPVEPQKEALNLSDPTQPSVKREPEHRDSPPPPKKFSKDDDEQKISPATHIKINSRGDARNGDSSLVVSMELNGITYQGVLFAQSSPSSGRTAMAS